MIFHLLIVDDEPTIRKGLSSFIKWDSLDCVVDAAAGNGLEAMELIRKNKPDIVITDIKMPQVDGIELSKFIHENYPEIKVILLTGYADFQYAQSAIRYNVSDFILKPTSRDKLTASVKKAQSSIAEARNRTIVSKADFSYLQQQFLEELTTVPQDAAFMDTKAAYYGISVKDFLVAAFQLNHFDNEPDGEELSLLKEALMKQEGHHYTYRYGMHLVIWVYQTMTSSPDEPNKLEKICMELCDSIASLYNLKLSIGISLPHHSLSELPAAVREAIGALNMNFYNDCVLTVYHLPTDESMCEIDSEYTLDLYNFENYLKTWEFDLAYQCIHSMFAKLKLHLTRAFEVKNICVQIYYIFSRILIKKNMIPSGPDLLQRIQECTTIGQLERIINQLFEYETSMLTTQGRELSSVNEKAVLYIRSHLEEALSLEIIAEHVHVNPSHLSRTFKKECGRSMTEYINKVRIEKAQELLLSNTLAYEVAEKVGFHDPAYFSATFKKYTGVSPKEFKQMHLS